MTSREASGALVLAGAAALLLPGLGALPISRAEIFFLDAARAMAESGDWLVPRYEGEPFFDKPALAYWAMAAAFRGLGPEPAAARFVSVLFALGVVASTLWLGRQLFDARTALAGGVVLATTTAFVSFGRIAMADMPLCFFATLAAGLGVRSWRPGPPAWTGPALGAALGLGFLAKGPIALVVAGSALLALALVHRRGPALTRASAAGAALAFAATGLGWFALLLARAGPAPLEHFFLRENLRRFADTTYALGQPAWFYLGAYLAGGLPWSPWLPLAAWRAASEPEPGARASGRFLLAWVALVLLPLTLSRGKVDYYLLPLYPALSLLVGRHLTAAAWRRLDRSWASVVCLVLAIVLATAAQRPPRVPEPWLPAPWARVLLVGVLLAGAAALALAAWRPGPVRVAATLAGSVSALVLVLAGFFLAACSDPARVRRDLLFRARASVLPRCNLGALAGSAAPHLLLASPEEEAQLRAVPGLRRIGSFPYLPAAITPRWILQGPEAAEVVLLANFPASR